jgi:hypothetical protein
MTLTTAMALHHRTVTKIKNDSKDNGEVPASSSDNSRKQRNLQVANEGTSAKRRTKKATL